MKKTIITINLILLVVLQSFTAYATDYSSKLNLDKYAEHLKSKTYSDTVTVAVIDSGAADIEILKDKTVPGYDFADDDNDPSNDIAADSHGTFIASIIAEAAKELPIKIMPVRILENKDVSAENLIKGIKYAVDNGADVLNISIGGELTDCSEIDKAIAYADEHNAVVAVSAGNARKEIKTYCPSHNESAVVVSAVTKDNVFAGYSNFGDTVDCCAPGDSVDGYTSSGEKATANGTSFSAAYITAGAAMLKLEHPEYTADKVQETIKSICVDLGAEGKDKYYGYGLPDFKRLIPSSVNIKGYEEEIKIPYQATLKLQAETYVPFEPEIKWYINNEYYMSGKKFDIENVTEDFSVYFEATDENGYTLKSETETVKVKKSFFDKLIAFFRQLLNIPKIIEQ